MYEQILVPLDGSKLAEVALPYAEELASRLKTEVILLQVEPRVYRMYGFYSQVPFTDEEMEPIKRSAQSYLRRVANKLKGKDIVTQTEVRVGAEADEIIKLAKENSVDMVIMTTHGRAGISNLALGSVADKVVRGTRQPVAIIRTKGSFSDMRKKGILHRALVPLDGSKASEAVIPYIEDLASRLEVEVTLFHMLALDHRIFRERQLGQTESLRASARDYIEKVAAQLKQKGIVTMAEFTEVIEGTEAEEIIRLAKKNQTDVVAMSTHGRSGISRWAFGSVAYRVLQEGNAPLLLVKPH